MNNTSDYPGMVIKTFWKMFKINTLCIPATNIALDFGIIVKSCRIIEHVRNFVFTVMIVCKYIRIKLAKMLLIFL